MGLRRPYLIFVTGTTGGARGEKICHVEKFLHMTYCHLERFSTWQIDMWKKFSILEMWRKSVMWRNRLSYGEISPHEKYGAKSVVWRKFLHMINVDSNLSCGEMIHHLLIYQINVVFYNAYCAVLLQNRLILRFTLFCRKICFVAIYALLRGEKLSKKLCPWRKKDKYDVWYRYWYLSNVSIYRQSIFHIGKAIVGRIYPIPLYTPNDIHPPIFGKKCTILMYTQTDVHHSTLGPKVPQTPINF